jgi:hypothetical protein
MRLPKNRTAKSDTDRFSFDGIGYVCEAIRVRSPTVREGHIIRNIGEITPERGQTFTSGGAGPSGDIHD